jgi:hypothetical protein
MTPDMMTTDKTPLFIRLAPEIIEAVKQAAADDGRSVSNYVEMLLADRLRKKGYLQDKAKKK